MLELIALLSLPAFFVIFVVMERLIPARPLPKMSWWKSKGVLFMVIMGVISTFAPLLWLDWIIAHPNTEKECGIIIRWSEYGNYPDFITSLTCGVKLHTTVGGGQSRIIEVSLFVPGL